MSQSMRQALDVLFLAFNWSLDAGHDGLDQAFNGIRPGLFAGQGFQLFMDRTDAFALGGNACIRHDAAAPADDCIIRETGQQHIDGFQPFGQVCAGDEGRLIFHHEVANENNFGFGQHYPDRASGWAGMVLHCDREIAPLNRHARSKRNLGRCPADIAHSSHRFPIRAGFLALGLEGVRPVAESFGGALVRHDGAVHGARPQCAVWVTVEIDQQAFHAAVEAQKGGAPGAAVFRRGRRINLDQPVRQGDCAECHTGVLFFYINLTGQ